MTTCPRCGRVADDEFVCGECGAFLAADDEQPRGEVPVRRVALLAVAVCLLGVGAAAVLLRQDDGGQPTGVAPPLSGPSSALSSGPLGGPGAGSFPDDSSSTPPLATSSLSTSASRTSSSSASATDSTSSHASRSAHPTSTAPTTSPPRSRSTTPSSPPSSTRPTTTHPPSSTPPSSPPPPQPSVQLARGASCGPHCYALSVSLDSFPAGAHTVTCWTSGGEFDSYTTSATESAGCSYRHPNASVWVIVEGHRSNTVNW